MPSLGNKRQESSPSWGYKGKARTRGNDSHPNSTIEDDL